MTRQAEAKSRESRGGPREKRKRRRSGGRRKAKGGPRRRGGSSGGNGGDGGTDDTFRELVVSADPGQTRVALVENGQLVEFLVERPEQRRIVGDIYKGKVTAILPGIQAGFLDLGLEKGAFLHVSDLNPDLDEFDVEDDDNGGGGGGGRSRRHAPRVPIEDQLKKGDELLVQVIKEPIGTKGPRVTAQITLPGRFVVLMPDMEHIGVSRKIDDRAERARLRKIIQTNKPEGCGVITRTVGSGEPEEAFERDISYLHGLWKKMQRDGAACSAPALVHRDLTLTTGLIRDVFSDKFDRIVVDDVDEYEQILEYVDSISPELGDRVELYEDEVPIYDSFGIEPEIEKTLHRKVWMKKGGYLCIDQAEALIAIDINTGRYKGKSDQEETIFRCNLEAAREIPRQLRLRDIGGLVVIDFIDMASEENRAAVLEELRRHLRKDRARTKTFPITELGLVEMTRQRVGPAMSSYYSVGCPECDGTGRVLSRDSMLTMVERIVRRIGRKTMIPRVELRVHPLRADFLLDAGFERIEALEERYDLAVDIRDDRNLHHDDLKVLDDKGRDITEKYS